MKLNRKKIFFLSLAVLSLLVGCNQQQKSKVAVINGESITADELYNHMEVKSIVRVRDNNMNEYDMSLADTIAFQTLQDLVRQKALLQLAKEENVLPTEEETNKELEFRKRLNPNFVQQALSRGAGPDQLRKMLKVELAEEKLIAKGIAVSKKDAEDFVKENPKLFVVPATVDLVWIQVLNDEKKQKVDAELSSGQSFESVAARFNQAPNAVKYRNRFPVRNIEALPDPVKSIAQSTEQGKYSDWVKIGQSSARFYVENKTPEQKQSIDDARIEMVQRQIAINRGRKAKDLPRIIFERIRNSNVEIAQPNLKELWKTYEQQIKKVELNSAKKETNDSMQKSDSSAK